MSRFSIVIAVGLIAASLAGCTQVVTGHAASRAGSSVPPSSAVSTPSRQASGEPLLISDINSDTVFVLDSGSLKVTASVSVGRRPFRPMPTPDGRYALVANNEGASVSVIDIARAQVIKTIETAAYPLAAVYSPDGRYAYVSCWGGDTGTSYVARIDLRTWTVDARLLPGSQPQETVRSPDGTRLYVPEYGRDTLAVLDSATGATVRTIPIGAAPSFVEISPNGRTVLAFAFGDRDFGASATVVDTATFRAAHIDMRAQALDAEFSPDSRQVYLLTGVTSSSPGLLSVRDPQNLTVTSSIDVGRGAAIAGIRHNGGQLVVIDYEDADVRLVDVTPMHVVRTIRYPTSANQLVVSQDGRALITVNRAAEAQVVDLGD